MVEVMVRVDVGAMTVTVLVAPAQVVVMVGPTIMRVTV
jgi:hypothetical protein